VGFRTAVNCDKILLNACNKNIKIGQLAHSPVKLAETGGFGMPASLAETMRLWLAGVQDMHIGSRIMMNRLVPK